MPRYLSQQTIQDAIDRLGISSAKPSVGDYLVFKRARKRGGSTEIDTGTQSVSFIEAHIDVGLWVPRERVLRVVGGGTIVSCMQTLIGKGGNAAKRRDPALVSPYFVPFGARRDRTLGYRQAKWPSNGPSDTVSRWQSRSGRPLVHVPGTTDPKAYQFEVRAVPELRKFFIVANAQTHSSGECPRLEDAAVWWFRSTDVSERFGHDPTPEELVRAFIEDVDLTQTEIEGIFESVGGVAQRDQPFTDESDGEDE